MILNCLKNWEVYRILGIWGKKKQAHLGPV
jgi:hypothetical protein